MSTAPRAPGEATSPAGTIALFYQWYNYDEIRMALASKYFTLQSTSGYTTKFLCNKDCKIKFSFLRNSPGGFWLTFNGNVISEGFTVEMKKGTLNSIGYSHGSSFSSGYFMLIANFIK